MIVHYFFNPSFPNSSHPLYGEESKSSRERWSWCNTTDTSHCWYGHYYGKTFNRRCSGGGYRNRNPYLMGHKGDTILDTGYFFAPEIPLQIAGSILE